MKTKHPSVYRGAILHFHSDPAIDGESAVEYHEDGILIVDEGKIVAMGDAEPMLAELDHPANLVDYSGHLIIPGLIDSHIHFPQYEVIASYGEQLMDWLNQYTFPAESAFKDPRHALEIAELFLDELLRNGTTTAMVYASVHKSAVEAFFEVSKARNTRMLCGKVMMDRNAPAELCDTPESSYEDSKALIEKWHNNGRQQYVITPRFAITSTPEQLALAGKLHEEYPDTAIQTHISENQDEIAFVKQLYPAAQDYLDVYDQYGLVNQRSALGHGIHLSDRELQRIAESGAHIAFCPTSNLFLGSGLLDLKRLDDFGVRYSVATDVGGGTSFSMLRTLSEAYKICQLNHYKLDPLRSLYLATLGNARCLGLDDRIGSFKTGNEADFVVINHGATPLTKRKHSSANSLMEQLFNLITLGDDRAIYRTYIAGKLAYKAAEQADKE